MRSEGYTTQFRKIGTPEALFHSTFTSTNRKLRTAAKSLLTLSGDPAVRKCSAEIENVRAELWEDWKRNALTPQMAAVMGEARDPHHGPFIVQHGSLKKFGPYLDDALERFDEQLLHLGRRRTGETAIEGTTAKMTSFVSTIREAWAAATSPMNQSHQ